MLAAVDREGRAGDEIGVVGDQEQNSAGNALAFLKRLTRSVQNMPDIARAVKYPNDLRAIAERPVEYDVATICNATQSWHQFAPGTASQGT